MKKLAKLLVFLLLAGVLSGCAEEVVEEEIEIFIKANPAEAVGLIKSYLKSWPNDEKSVEFKQKLPELVKAAKEFKAFV